VATQNPFPIPPFNCPSLSAPPPSTDVTQLRPGNIKVIMAMGDSISAGFAMKGDVLENRGLVYSIGGDEQAATVPNWLKTYSPNVQGIATGITLPLSRGAWLDAAVSAAQVQDLTSQVQYLVQTMQTTYSSTINFKDDWKVLTLLIGANNLCICCGNNEHGSVTYFEQNLRSTLTLIQRSIPRVFVNVMSLFNISGVWTVGQKSLYCRILWEGITNSECPCLLSGKASDRQAMDDHSVAFNEVIQRLADEFSTATTGNKNFTVVAQPGLSGLPIDTLGSGFLSTLDCFHPNVYANEAFANALWNNMQTPVGKKSTTINPDDIFFLCPSDSSFLQ